MAISPPERSVQNKAEGTQVLRKHCRFKTKQNSSMLFKDQKLLPSSLPLDPRASVCVTNKEPLDYGSGDGRREETPAWSNNGYYLDRKSFPKDIADQLWELCLQQWKTTPLEAEFGIIINNSG